MDDDVKERDVKRLFDLESILFAFNQSELAQAVLAKACLLASSPSDLMGCGQLFVERYKKYSAALPLFERARKLPDCSPTVYILLAHTYLALERRSDTINSCNISIEKEPKNDQAYIVRGVAHRQIGKLNEARLDFQTALKLRRSESASLHLSQLELAEGNLTEALAVIEQSLKLNPNDLNTHNQKWKLLMELNRPREALTEIEKCIKLEPDLEADLREARANLLLRAKRPVDALVEVTQLIRTRPSASLYMFRSTLFEQDGLGSPASIVSDCSASITYGTNIPEMWMRRARAFMKLKQYREALADCDSAIALKKSPSFMQFRASVYCELSEYGKAEKDLNQALSLRPNARAFRMRAVVNTRLKHFQSALADCDKAIALEPSDGWTRSFRRKLRIKEGGEPLDPQPDSNVRRGSKPRMLNSIPKSEGQD